MLETIHLSKTYRPRKGVPVKALDDINLRFPERGMVFLLGKSGSGKSTLLNLLGGLDKYDGGEIIIKGVSSKHFRQQHFDSYRNTYVGFIFQEYNVLEDFTVGANIALALELQGKRATDEELNRILGEVDLAGYGNRRPNELSGGQKQRVAIARALVKSPEIIMADEPTGALDSNTGRQVFDTLKKLSAEKLVIVVSHDREFAEQYADRIIELSDGRVLSDVEVAPESAVQPEGLTYTDSAVEIPAGYHLTEEDRLAINAYLDARRAGKTSLQLPAGGSHRFTETKTIDAPREDGSKFSLIKSKLPLHNAFKIGAGGLKHKKFRLVMTVLLSFVAFTLFALADTFGAYDHIKTTTSSIVDSGVTYAALEKQTERKSGDYSWWRSGKLSAADIEKLQKDTGLTLTGIYRPEWNMSLKGSFDPDIELTKTAYNIYSINLYGFAEITEDSLKEMNYPLLAGRLPDGSRNEIAISAYSCRVFIKAGYTDGQLVEKEDGTTGYVYEPISREADMVGKTLVLNGTTYTVTGVVDTQFNWERYESLMEEKKNISAKDEILQMVLANEYSCEDQYSLGSVAMVGAGFIKRVVGETPAVQYLNDSYLFIRQDTQAMNEKEFNIQAVMRLADADHSSIVWLNGEKSTLAANEIILTTNCMRLMNWEQSGPDSYSGQSVPVTDYQEFLRDQSDLRMDTESGTLEGCRIVGYLPVEEDTPCIAILADSLADTLVGDGTAIFTAAVGSMPSSRDEVNDLVVYSNTPVDGVRYSIMNAVTYELDIVNDILKELSVVFLYIGIGFAVFAAIMLANFIAVSISYKKQEIGILRAIGSRSGDVFRIFFSESFLIAMMNFLLAVIGTVSATAIINYFIRTRAGILVTVLTFGPRQVLLLLVISVAVAALSSFLPVWRIASKRPIDAIRNR